MALDEKDKRRARIKKLVDRGAVKITAKNKNLLSNTQLKRYEDAKDQQNVVYLKGKRLYEFDSETSRPVEKVGMLKAGGAKMRGGQEAVDELQKEKRIKANLDKNRFVKLRNPRSPTDSSMSGKAYSTALGMSLPRRKPRRAATPAEMRKLEKNVRGRKAVGNKD
tara:strand:- start:710 stop:1204 length:495 start_codon:yes stop_codon:yes gene_type:complete